MAAQGVDTIVDFQPGIDRLWIDSRWGGGFTVEDLTASQFRSGAGITTANTAAQRLIYNTTTGGLFFDADGVGGADATRIAVLANHAAITFGDIVIGWL